MKNNEIIKIKTNILLYVVFKIFIIYMFFFIKFANKCRFKSKIEKINPRTYTQDEVSKVSLYKYIKLNKKYFKNKTNIHISYAFTESICYQALVSMTSIMENCDYNKTIVSFYLFIPSNTKNQTIQIVESIVSKYPFNSELTIYKMKNSFNNSKPFKGSTVTYYRLIIPEILTNIDRIIYLDTDTLTFTDLTEMYLTPFNNNYILGFLDIRPHQLKYLNLATCNYICAGVILMNLKKMRQDNKGEEMIEFSVVKRKIIQFNDQDIINYILHPGVGILPLRYGMFNFKSKEHAKKGYLPFIKKSLNKTELFSAIEKPGIIHYVYCFPKFYKKKSKYGYKPHRGEPCKEGFNAFYYYANKTNYYQKIKKLMY